MRLILREGRKALGGRLFERRRELGWTQVATASRLGVYSHMVGKWERGAHVPNPKQAEAILEFLGLAEFPKSPEGGGGGDEPPSSKS